MTFTLSLLVRAWLATASHQAGVPGPVAYVIEPPDVVRVTVSGLPKKARGVADNYLVRPDGTLDLPGYGELAVAGLTRDQAERAVRDLLTARLNPRRKGRVEVRVEIASANSKWLFIVTERGGQEQVTRTPFTANQTVLDAVAANPAAILEQSPRNIWIARRTPGNRQDQILPVDWVGITAHGNAQTNYQLMAGDRLHVRHAPGK